MAIAIVGAWTAQQFNNGTGGTTAARTVTAGNHLVFSSSLWASSLPSTWTVATSQSDVLAMAWGPVADPQSFYTRQQYAENAVGGSTTITLSGGAGSGNYFAIAAGEYSGIALTGSLDQTATSSGNGSTFTSTATATTTQDDELVCGSGLADDSVSRSWTAGSGYAIRSSIGAGNLGGCLLLEDKIVAAAAAETATATWPVAVDWAFGVATYKAEGGAPATPPHTRCRRYFLRR